MTTPVQRLRLCYAQTGDARYVGHLDTARFWERAFRRVDLPLAYTQGYNPQARMQFASALPVGIAGENELLDVWLKERIEPQSWLARIRQTLPSGFWLKSIQEVPLKAPAMQSQLRFARYSVAFGEGITADELEARVQRLLVATELWRPHHKRKDKTYDLRALIVEMAVEKREEGPLLRMLVRSGGQGNARVEEVLDALGVLDIPHDTVRHELIFASSQGEKEETGSENTVNQT
jgi:radical SAM-linked protein